MKPVFPNAGQLFYSDLPYAELVEDLINDLLFNETYAVSESSALLGEALDISSWF